MHFSYWPAPFGYTTRCLHNFHFYLLLWITIIMLNKHGIFNLAEAVEM